MFGMNAVVAVNDKLPAPIWPTQHTMDMGCNLWPLHQWGDAMSTISTKEPVMGSNRRAATHLGAGCHICPRTGYETLRDSPNVENIRSKHKSI